MVNAFKIRSNLMSKCVFFVILIFPSILWSQNYSNKVIDFETKEPLAFVNVVLSNERQGTTSDIDGRFNISLKNENEIVHFTYVGYQRLSISAKELKDRNEVVELKRAAVQISEVEILPGVNPAHRIINNAIENRKINNPEKATSFFYQSYNKLVFAIEADSLMAEKIRTTPFEELDSNTQEAVEFIDSMHLFMMESVSERNHYPPKMSNEVVIASKVSGFNNPTFSLIGTQLQSFSLYNDYIELFSYSYLSPISPGSVNKYLFILEDTLYSGSDSVFVISYRPKRGKNFDGLKGVISINTDHFAVQNFIAEAKSEEDLTVKIQQQYQKVDNQQWFPIQLNTYLVFESLEVDNFFIYGEGRSYIDSIELKARMDKRQMDNVLLAVREDAGKKELDFWDQFRKEELSTQEKKTYQFLDSVGNEINLDQKFKVIESLVRGAVPLGPIDFRLNRLLDFNGYEGFRLGLGAETNQKVHKTLSIGGYGAYGFRDRAWKYGGYSQWKKANGSFMKARLSYEDDVVESGGSPLLNERVNVFSSEALRELFINLMDSRRMYQFELELHPLRDLQSAVFVNHQLRSINNNYLFQNEANSSNPILISNFKLTEAGIKMRYSPGEKYVKMFGVQTAVTNFNPVFDLKYSRGFDQYEGDFTYNRFDFKAQKAFKLRNLGLTILRLHSGYIDNVLPITALYRANGILTNDAILAADFSFQTARPNEFFHDRYVSFFFKHSFQNLLLKTKFFKPEIALVSNIGWGSISSRERHQAFDFKTMSKGFFEAGIQFDRLFGFVDRILEEIELDGFNFGNFGLGIYYRYGAYSFAEVEDNIAIKATYSVKF